MKNLFKITALSIGLLVSNNGNTIAQTDVCSKVVFNYKGPKSTRELQILLNTSTNPALQNLSTATKASLVKNMVFVNGIAKGIDGPDADMDALIASGHFKQVMSAIFSIKDVRVADHKIDWGPASVSYADFLKGVLNPQNPGDPANTPTGGIGICTRCAYRSGDYNDHCCHPCQDCGECIDYVTFLNGVVIRVE